jgi:hypothetical protein
MVTSFQWCVVACPVVIILFGFKKEEKQQNKKVNERIE